MTLFLTSGIHFALDLAVKATVVFLLTGAALLCLSRSSAATRHLVGAFGLTAALLLPVLSLALPRVPVPLLPDPRPRTRAAADAPPSVAAAARSEEARLASWRRLALSVPEKALPALRDELATPAAGEAPRERQPISLFSWLIAALAAWALGSLAFAARLAVGSARVRRIALAAQPICDAGWIEERDTLARRLDVGRRVEMMESASVPVAMTSGLLRPLLLLGQAARVWAVERRRVVLLHELAHVKRGDWATLLVSELAMAVYWFHPLAWWLGRRVRRDAERATDDLVLSAGTKPSVYAGHLLGIFRSLASPSHPVAPALAIVRPSHFEERLRAILDPRAARRQEPTRRTRLAAAGLLLASAVGVAVVEPWTSKPAGAAILHAEETGTPAGTPWTVMSAPPASGSQCPKTPACSSRGKASPAAVSGKAPEVEQRPDSPQDPPQARSWPALWTAHQGEAPDAASGFVRASNRKPPRDGRDWYDRGMELHRSERYEEAIEAFQKAIAAGDREGAASYNVACGYARMGNRDQAIEWLRRAMDVGFDVASYLGHDDDLESLRSDPRWAELKKTARERKSTRHADEARAVAARYERLAAHPTADGEPFFHIGRELLKVDRHDFAAKAFAAAAERGYRTGTSLYNQACALSLAGDRNAALDLLARALEAGFDQPGLLEKDEDLDAIRDDPRFAELLLEARELSLPGFGPDSELRSGRGKWRAAARRYEDYARRRPENGRAWFNLGFASLAGDLPEAAADAFGKALDLGYRRSTTMYNLACVHARLDRKEVAFEWLFRALDAGFDQAGTLRSDDDLDNLRGDPRYRKALEIARAKESRDEER